MFDTFRRIAAVTCALVLDGQECHALSAVRSLGRRGVEVAVGSHKPKAMSFASRFCRTKLHTPSPSLEPQAYADWLLETLSRKRYDALLFFGEATGEMIATQREAIQKLTGCPMPDRESFEIAQRKDLTVRLARRIGVPVPETHELARMSELPSLAQRLQFPVVVKGVQGSGGRQVRVARTPQELASAVADLTVQHGDMPQFPIVQEFIAGSGYGVSALMRQGEPLAVFMHRRLAEHDVRRGLATAHAASGAESIVDAELRELGIALLRDLRWDGMAMVEFRRRTTDGRFFLMEINPRFVGSLDLAVAAGVDFPWLYVQLARGESVQAPADYCVGLKYRWLISKNVAPALEHPFQYVQGVLSTLRPDTCSDVSFRDPGPHVVHLHDAAWWIREHRAPKAS